MNHIFRKGAVNSIEAFRTTSEKENQLFLEIGIKVYLNSGQIHSILFFNSIYTDGKDLYDDKEKNEALKSLRDDIKLIYEVISKQ